MTDIETKRPIPEYLRRSFTSNSKAKIERALTRAFSEGFTKEEISEAFQVSRNSKPGSPPGALNLEAERHTL